MPEVASFPVIAGVDPKVSLVTFGNAMPEPIFFGECPVMVTAAARSVSLVIDHKVNQHNLEYIFRQFYWRDDSNSLQPDGYGATDALIPHAMMLTLTPPKWHKAANVTAKTASPAQGK
nr:hypothetical protein [Kosakonia oryziphila]